MALNVSSLWPILTFRNKQTILTKISNLEIQFETNLKLTGPFQFNSIHPLKMDKPDVFDKKKLMLRKALYVDEKTIEQ